MSTPLYLVKNGNIAVIKTLQFEKAIIKKLKTMGLVPKSIITIVLRNYDGSLIVKLNGLKVAISAYISQHLIVTPL